MKTDFLNKRVLPLGEMMPLIVEHLQGGNSVRLSPKGISMLPMLREGTDSVVLSPVPEKIKKFDIALYQRENGQYILHRIVKNGSTFVCIGDNQFKFEKGVKREQLIAVVTSFNRGNKSYSVKAFSYKMYCIFWHYSRFFRHIYRALKWRVEKVFRG